MSIKRSKPRNYNFGRYADEAAASWAKPEQNEPEKTWEEYMEGQPDEAFSTYSLRSRFNKGELIQHSKFGKGIVMNVDPSSVDVLFSEGKKKLGHGKA
jgi:hypothetical protein